MAHPHAPDHGRATFNSIHSALKAVANAGPEARLKMSTAAQGVLTGQTPAQVRKQNYNKR